MINSEQAAVKWIALVSAAHSKCSIAVREHLGDYQLMCHAPVAPDVTAATFLTLRECSWDSNLSWHP